MKVVTGYKGFIASNLIKRFNSNDLILIEKDYCFESLDKIDWKKVDHIYHMGAISDTTCDDLDYIHLYNIKFTLELFNYAIEYQIPISYASSASVYGNSLTYAYNPLNHYAISKTNIDIWVESNIDKFKNIIGYRFFNVYGEGEKHKANQASPIHKFTRQANLYQKIKLFKNSDECIRDFIWVEDVIDCMLENKPSGIYDVGTSNPVSFKYIANLISEKYNCNIEEIDFPEKLKHKYQFYTCARNHFNKKFTTVDEYINRLQ